MKMVFTMLCNILFLMINLSDHITNYIVSISYGWSQTKHIYNRVRIE